jgi:predicted aspartyl protease
MQDMGGRPVIELRLNGKGPYRFILDTGASVSVVSTDLDSELSLPRSPGVHAASSADGSAPAIVEISETRIGDAVLSGLIAAVMPLGKLLTGENAPRGVISAASFPGYLVTFDYPAKLITIAKGELKAPDSRSTFEYADSEIIPKIPVSVAGHETAVHIDTGSSFGLTLPARFLQELPLASPPRDAGTERTPGGKFAASMAAVRGYIEIGQYKLDIPEVRFSDVRPGNDPAVGNIGYEVLRTFVLTFDSKNRRIQLSR